MSISLLPVSFCNSAQFFRSIVSDSLRPHGLQHARLPCPSPTPRVYSNSCIFFRRFITLTLKSLIHLSKFLWGIDSGQISSHVAFQFFNTIYQRDCSFPIIYFWVLCHKLIHHLCFFLASLCCPIDLCVYFYANMMCFN